MLPDADARLVLARAAAADELNALVHEADEKFLLALLENPNISEKHVESLLDRLDLPAPVLSAIAETGKWMGVEGVRFRLAKHPHAPRRFALAALKQLFLFDLVRLSLLPAAPPDVRHVAEEAILTRIPHLPVGEKLTLARRGPARVAGAILAEGHPQALKLALDNAFLTESQVLKVLAKKDVGERVVAAIAGHAKWSCQYNVRAALLRNEHTPVAKLQAFVRDLALHDLKDISQMREMSEPVRNLIEAEFARRAGREESGAK
jgi:hypothetical protein